MAEYWKSQPKKFCEYCKCWLSDNKASIQFHESGNRHKKNVEEKLNQLQKKGAEDFRQNQRMGQTMLEVEKAALRALEKDISSDPSLASQYRSDIAQLAGLRDAKDLQEAIKLKRKEESDKAKTKVKPEKWNVPPTEARMIAEAQAREDLAKKKRREERKKKHGEWKEAKTAEGYTYFWHTKTNETKWEKPDEENDDKLDEEPIKKAIKVERKVEMEKTGATSILKIKWKAKASDMKSEEKSESKPSRVSESSDTKDSSATPSIGKWQQVVQPDSVDLQLPSAHYSHSQQPVIECEEEPRPKMKDMFKEKTVASSGASVATKTTFSFKKRKVTSGAQNTRQRLQEDT